jgi:hypothetical protein
MVEATETLKDAVLLGQLKPLVQLLLELAITHLLQDVCVPGLINLECLTAVRADDFMHSLFTFRFSQDS